MKNIIRRSFECIGKTFGLTVVPEWRVIRVTEERHLRRLFETFDVDCVFDVGANVGQYGQMLRKYVGYEGRIISFEPNPVAFKKLQALVAKDDLWTCENFALGSEAGSLEFHAYDESLLGSLHALKDSPFTPKGDAGKTISVRVETIETYFPIAAEQWGFQRPFLKMDTQGHDLEAAKGAGSRIREFSGLQSEISFQNLYEDSPDYRAAIAFYEASGFSLSQLVPIHDIHFPSLVEMDVLMVRSDLL